MYNSYLNDLNDDENYQSFLLKIPLDDDYKPNLIIDNEKINNKIENGNGNKEIKIECIKTEQSSNQRKEEVILDAKKEKKKKMEKKQIKKVY